MSSSDLDAHERFFAAFGLEAEGDAVLDAAAALGAWGVGAPARERWLRAPGTRFGVRLVAFEAAGGAIRPAGTGGHVDAPKVIDFRVADMGAALGALRAAGLWPAEPAAYRTADGAYREAHVAGPDGVVAALLEGPLEGMFAAPGGRLFSEPFAVSAPASDTDAVRAALAAAGLRELGGYAVEDAGFAAMAGTGAAGLRAVNMGTRPAHPHLGVIGYAGERPRLDVRLPGRGIVGATLVADALEPVLAACGAWAAAGPGALDLPAHGPCRQALLRLPGGWRLALLEPPATVKILRAEEWAAFEREGVFAGSADDARDGFIHLSTPAQLPGTVARHFAGVEGLVAVTLDLAGDPALRWEVSRGGARFPHLHRPLTVADIAAARDWVPPATAAGS